MPVAAEQPPGQGYRYEADSVLACIERGAIDGATVPLNDSLAEVETAEKTRGAMQRGIFKRDGAS